MEIIISQRPSLVRQYGFEKGRGAEFCALCVSAVNKYHLGKARGLRYACAYNSMIRSTMLDQVKWART